MDKDKVMDNTVVLFKFNVKKPTPESASAKSDPEPQVPPSPDTNIRKTIFDMNRWTDIMKKEIEYLIDQAHVLLEAKERLNLTIQMLDRMSNTCKEQVEIRKQRCIQSKEADIIDRSLESEVENYQSLKAELARNIVPFNKKIQALRKIRISIETEVVKKEEARQNEHCARLMRRLGPELRGKVVPQVTLGDPNVWLTKVQDLVKNSREERKSSVSLLPGAHQVLIRAGNSMFGLWNDTTKLLRTSVQSMKQTKNKAVGIYDQTIKESKVLNSYLAELEKCIRKKTTSLRKVEANLDKKRHFSGLELCSDPTTLKWLKEVQFIKLGIETLRKRVTEVQDALDLLKKTERTTGKEIKLVNATLYIDEIRCLQTRNDESVSSFYDIRFQFGGKPRLNYPMVR